MNYDNYNDNVNETNNSNINYNNNSYYNDSNTPEVSEQKSNTTKRKILRFISRIILLIVLVFIVMMILSSLKLIKLPWLDYPEVLNLSQSEIVLKQKGNFQLSSNVYPSQVPYGRILYESSDPDVVTVNQITGFIVAKKNGVATITAKLEEYEDILDTCDVVVSDTVVYISKIKVSNSTINLVVGKEHIMEYSYEPNNASVHKFLFSSSDENIATVDENGLIKAKSEGTAIITITDKSSNVSATQTINVYNSQPIEKVKASHSKVTLVVDGSIQLTASVKPSEAIQTITWSSVNPKIATVSSNGLVTGINYGSTKVIATAVDGTNAVIDVKVQEKSIAVESVSINQDDITIDVGKSKRLKTTIKPSDATNQSVTWLSSDTNVATVSSSGNVQGINPGTAKITVKTNSGSKTASINVTVKSVQIIKETDIKLTVPTSSINIGKTVTIKGEVLPENATYKNLTWSSSNTNIATIKNGTVYGVAEGNVTITVSSRNGLSKSVNIKVSSIPVSSISLSDEKRKINIGEEYSLIATISPSDASNKNLTWTSSNASVITVNAKGLVTPHSVGTATITAKSYNGKTASCVFTVTNEAIMPKSVSISKSQVEVKKNGTIGLTAIVQPSNATSQKVSWNVESGTYATINEQGIITGLTDGVTKVTAKTVNGKTASAFIVVKSNNNTKYNYLNGSTIKYWIENNSSKNAYITHIWVKDAYNQFATMLPSKFPGLATATTLMKRVASKYPNKATVGVNASGFVIYNKQDGSGFNTQFAKFNSNWNRTPAIPYVISEGVVKRDFSSAKMPDSHIYTYGLKKNKWIDSYTYSNGSDVEKNKATTQKIKSDGVKNTFGFYPVLVRSGKVIATSKSRNIKQAICQIDTYNFVIYTNISNDREKGFSPKSLADLMIENKCYHGFNLDGGGSTNLLYKKKDSNTIIGVRTTSRSIGDIIYFYGD